MTKFQNYFSEFTQDFDGVRFGVNITDFRDETYQNVQNHCQHAYGSVLRWIWSIWDVIMLAKKFWENFN